ncbi:hypothetical protein LTR66_017424 [Elasticomyces elasticus]|nr:hypothetical protein LTR66_017424 [Elasticomyces elasticus]
MNETINELGEGRGIYGPGYEERRAQRIKEAYGIDVPKPFWETREAAEPMKAYSKPLLKEEIQARA